ncbi:MAG: ankyrin repeat domain-containing protein [Polaribacter sp.]|uniref:ankyrin repeat domain-containing protein n=1 Tax=Polaribacter sp. TaxID=1920175 RepID=UPI003BB1BA14
MKKEYFIMIRKILFIFFLSIYTVNGFSQEKSIFDIARNGSLIELKAAEKKNPEIINKVSKEGYTPLTLSCYSGNNEVAKYLINNVKNINAKSGYGTPLMAAVVKSNTELVMLLIKKKVNINATDPNGTTALHYAVMFDLEEITKLLVAAKASITLKDNRGNSALDYAKIKGNSNIIQLLNNK